MELFIRDANIVKPDRRCLKLGKDGLDCIINWKFTQASEYFKEASERCAAWHIPYDGQAVVARLQGQPEAASEFMLSAFQSSYMTIKRDIPRRLDALVHMNLTERQYKRITRWVQQVQQAFDQCPDRFTPFADDLEDICTNPSWFPKKYITERMGRLHLAHGHYQEANTCFEELLSDNKSFSDFLLLATSYAHMGKTQEAWAVIWRGCRRINFGTFILSGWIDEFGDGLIARCRSAMEQIYTLHQPAPALASAFALIQAISGKYESALKHAENAGRLYGDGGDSKQVSAYHAFLQLLNGYSAGENGDYRAAIKYFANAESQYAAINPFAGDNHIWLRCLVGNARLWLLDSVINKLVHEVCGTNSADLIGKILGTAREVLRSIFHAHENLRPRDFNMLLDGASVPLLFRCLFLEMFCGNREQTVHLQLRECITNTIRARPSAGYSRWFLQPYLDLTQPGKVWLSGLRPEHSGALTEPRNRYRHTLARFCDHLREHAGCITEPYNMFGSYQNSYPRFNIDSLSILAAYFLNPSYSPYEPTLDMRQVMRDIDERMFNNYWKDAGTIQYALSECLSLSQPSHDRACNNHSVLERRRP